jgi:hypothetical protein
MRLVEVFFLLLSFGLLELIDTLHTFYHFGVGDRKYISGYLGTSGDLTIREFVFIGSLQPGA